MDFLSLNAVEVTSLEGALYLSWRYAAGVVLFTLRHSWRLHAVRISDSGCHLLEEVKRRIKPESGVQTAARTPDGLGGHRQRRLDFGKDIHCATPPA